MAREYTDRDIECVPHTSWRDIVGNQDVTCHFKAMSRSVVGQQSGRGINTLVFGGSRTGKTSTIEFALKTMTCNNTDPEQLEPCGRCQPCVQHEGRFEMIETDILFGGCRKNVCFVPINGNAVTQCDLDRDLAKAMGRWDSKWIYYIDEIQGLVRRHLDHLLLKAVEQHKHITWIVSTATLRGLEPMFLNRFTCIRTQPPSIGELAIFLAKKCNEPSIRVNWDEDTTLLYLAKRSRCIPGLALKCLAAAKMFSCLLTKDFVESYPFEVRCNE